MNNRHKKKEDNITFPTYRTEETIYVFGFHMNKNGTHSKEYVWRVPKNLEERFGDEYIKENDLVKVHTHKGSRIVKVTRVVKSNIPPTDRPVLKIYHKVDSLPKIDKDVISDEKVLKCED
jgi:hypothetical protein